MDNESKAPNHDPASEAAMCDLLRHILDEYWSHGWEGAEEPHLIPAEFPDPLPVEVPLPDAIRVVGAVGWPRGTRTSLLFDSRQSREALARFYDERLLSSGWTKPDIPGPFGGGGFTNTMLETHRGVSYCMGDVGPSLQIRIYHRNEQTTSVNLTIETDPDASPCAPSQQRQWEMMQGRFPREVLPDLRPPEGAQQFSGGGSGRGSDNAASKALLYTELPLDQVLHHYDSQLQAAGWSNIGRGQSGPVAWSAWDFTSAGQVWHGFLTIAGQPWREGNFRLTLYAESENFGKRRGIIMPDF